MDKNNNEKSKKLDATIHQIRKMFGDGAIMRLGEKSHYDIEVIPTGSLALDIALGVGGLPRGRIIEIYGAESSGKTTIALLMVAEAQKKGGTAAFIDAEHALDPAYAKKLGVKVEELLVSQPDTGEQALEICDALVKSGSIDIIIVDSVAALVPKAEIDGDMGDSHIGLQARLMSQALRKLTASISKTKSIVVFINQIRMKISTLPFGNPETTTGGLALKFYSTVRIEVKKLDSIKKGDEVIGNKVKLIIRKNKVAPPFKIAQTSIFFNKGISKAFEVLQLGESAGIITKTGTWYSYGSTRLGQGVLNAMRFLEEHPDILSEVENKIRKEYNIPFEETSKSEESTEKTDNKTNNKKGNTNKTEKTARTKTKK